MRTMLLALFLGAVMGFTITNNPPTPMGSSDELGTIYFDDSDPDLIRLGTDAYEIGFRKSNGAIAYIHDQHTGSDISQGSRYECLWGAVFQVDSVFEYVGGCSYNKDWRNHFTYTWSSETHLLTMTYAPDPEVSEQVHATVWIQASDGNWVDLQMEVTNNYGHTLEYVHFPSDLVFLKDDLQEVLLPVLPGIVLEQGFFYSGKSYIVKFPGYPGIFADFMAIESTQGKLAIFTHQDSDLNPGWIGFNPDTEIPPYIEDSVYSINNFATLLEDGGTWLSPQVRISVGEGFEESITAYRNANALDSYASLFQKLGQDYEQVVESALYRAVANELGIQFSDYADDLLALVPIPGLLHPVGYQPGGHDELQPDYLPPDPLWGTQADFVNMVQSAQSMGFLVMPYTNPTWWDDESPTLQSLPIGLSIDDLAVLDAEGNPVYETYTHGSPPYPHGGYVMSPYQPFVQDRVDQMIEDMTITVPSDMLFEDQLGARPWLEDHNPYSPNPLAYIDGWLNHALTYQDKKLHTELAFDRLGAFEVGFHGSVLLPEYQGYTDEWWGNNYWRPYPLATMMMRDKVLFYQHDLGTETFTKNKPILSWNLAMGYQLSYDLHNNTGMGPNNPWIRVVGVFQKNALSKYAHERVTGYRFLTPEVSQTDFETCSVIKNWSTTQAFTHSGHTIPVQGVSVSCGWLTAGVYTAYNGINLSSGDHYLVEQRFSNTIIVWQPMGNTTSLTLLLPQTWQPTDPIEATAFTLDGQVLVSVPLVVTENNITAIYQEEINGQKVGFLQINNPLRRVYLPIVYH